MGSFVFCASARRLVALGTARAFGRWLAHSVWNRVFKGKIGNFGGFKTMRLGRTDCVPFSAILSENGTNGTLHGTSAVNYSFSTFLRNRSFPHFRIININP